ncbi:MAG: ArsR/SmtB family transcription factor [Promethearchaeota archaeon]
MVAAKSMARLVDINDDELEDMIDIFWTLSDPSRVKIIYSLNGEMKLSVSRIAELLGMKISLVSHHLSTLKRLGFVKRNKDGKEVFYEIADSCILDILQRARDHVTGN